MTGEVTTKPETATETLSPVLVVCAGKRRLDSKTTRPYVALIPMINGLPVGDEHLFPAKKRMCYLTVGGIYSIPASEGLKTIQLDPKYKGQYTGPEVSGWRAREDTELLALKLSKDEKVEKKVNRLAEVLNPLRKEYARLNYNDQVIFEVMILKALRRRAGK